MTLRAGAVAGKQNLRNSTLTEFSTSLVLDGGGSKMRAKKELSVDQCVFMYAERSFYTHIAVHRRKHVVVSIIGVTGTLRSYMIYR